MGLQTTDSLSLPTELSVCRVAERLGALVDNSHWYVAKTQARHEPQVESVLRLRGVEVFLPRILGRKKDVLGVRLAEPLFPGYLFACLDIKSNHWLSARSAPGVKYFLGAQGAGAPVAVPELVVSELRSQCEARMRSGWAPGFKSGDKVTILSGPLAGLEAVFDAVLTPAGRSRVFLAFLNRLVPVEVEVDLLRRAV